MFYKLHGISRTYRINLDRVLCVVSPITDDLANVVSEIYFAGGGRVEVESSQLKLDELLETIDRRESTQS
jgi:hypothetical protein